MSDYTGHFKASTQYGDWEGTAKADNAHDSLHEFLEKKNLMKHGDFLVAASLWSSERSIHLHAFVYDQGGDEYENVKKALAATNEPIPVRDISLELSLEEFLRLFKIFEVVLTWHGLGIEKREFSATRDSSHAA